MADIQRHLDNIADARKGEDVRWSIHDGIKAINEESAGARGCAETAKDSAKASAQAAKESEDNAKASETAAKDSENNIKASETAVKESENNAKASEDAAKESETNAGISENNAKASEVAAKESEVNAADSASIASQKATESENSAAAAAQKSEEAYTSASAAAVSESNAEDFSKKSESYAVGTGNTFRENDAVDNSKSYCELAKKNSDIAKEYLAKVERAGDDAVDKIHNALDISAPNFIVDLSTGNLFYEGGRFAFEVRKGNLEWGLAV